MTPNFAKLKKRVRTSFEILSLALKATVGRDSVSKLLRGAAMREVSLQLWLLASYATPLVYLAVLARPGFRSSVSETLIWISVAFVGFVGVGQYAFSKKLASSLDIQQKRASEHLFPDVKELNRREKKLLTTFVVVRKIISALIFSLALSSLITLFYNVLGLLLCLTIFALIFFARVGHWQIQTSQSWAIDKELRLSTSIAILMYLVIFTLTVPTSPDVLNSILVLFLLGRLLSIRIASLFVLSRQVRTKFIYIIFPGLQPEK